MPETGKQQVAKECEATETEAYLELPSRTGGRESAANNFLTR